MTNMAEIFFDGSRFLVSVDTEGVVQTSSGEQDARVQGELILQFAGDHPEMRGITVERFALAVGSVEAGRGDTGVISFKTVGSQGSLTMESETAEFGIETENRVNYESLDAIAVPGLLKGDYYIPAEEPAAGRIKGRLTATRESIEAELAIEIVCAAGEFEQVLGLQLELRSVRVRPLLTKPDSPAGRDTILANTGNDGQANACDLSLTVERRRMILQPVGFKDSATDASPTGGTAAAQLGAAVAIWSKACIDLQINPFVYVTNATLKTSSDRTAIRASYNHPDPNVIEVYFVANPLSGVGGGEAGGLGVASAKPVIAEPNGGNPVLTSHELGHVLGLLHPGAGSNSDVGTVMQPTGGAMNPGTSFVTHFMSTNIANPVLQTLAGDTCCLSHDIGNHYIRDFPVDAGVEPSDPLPVGMTRYSMSNVWNRLTNAPGVTGLATGPEHEQPVRFNADGTPRTNYLFARVEQLQNLKVRTASVRFYMKHPGSGGGVGDLQLLGEAPVPDPLSVSNALNVSIPWTVPAGAPQHSCVFAVVRSPAEPDGSQSGLDWWQFEILSHQDNDWAQRNLDIVPYASPNLDGTANVESAPFVIKIPLEQDVEDFEVALNVDARRAVRTDAIEVEVLGGERYAVTPGELTRLELRERLNPGSDLAFVVRVARPIASSTATVTIEPVVGKRRLVGYACDFRPARGPQAVRSILDTMHAAATDLAEGTGGSKAYTFQEESRKLLAAGLTSLDALASRTSDLKGPIDGLVFELAEQPAFGRYGVASAFRTWVDGLGGEPASSIEGFRALMQRLLMVASESIAERREAGVSTLVIDHCEVMRDEGAEDRPRRALTLSFKDADGAPERFPASGWYTLAPGKRNVAPIRADALECVASADSTALIEIHGLTADGNAETLGSAQLALNMATSGFTLEVKAADELWRVRGRVRRAESANPRSSS